ncbi:MAG: SDR family oxidoreductase [Acidobacteriaceae bacterium]|nr:SDR family oxidoreductase [Acidobacteriaceae bacterium]MBV9779963.1 SDR family oxidoreductase [Acidobacteriaceae bacterium]
MDTGLANRVAIVAGSSQGLGRAAAFALAAEGAYLALCARGRAALERTAHEIRERFRVRVYTETVDVRDSAAIEQFAKNVNKEFGRIDICVTNAGGPPAKWFLEATDADWNEAFSLNLLSAAVFARAVIPYMQQRQWGRIITISSITVRQPQPQLVLSNAIRAGVMGLVRSLANEFGKDGILVNNVAPGYTATERLKELSASRAAALGQSEEMVEQVWTEQIPLGRLGRPEELADAVVWLASERASFITGQTLLVDGGMYKGL